MTDKSALSNPKKIFMYYPQRVQVLVMALLNFGFVIASELGVAASATSIGVTNTLALSILVFFYGEKVTTSNQYLKEDPE